MALPTYGQDVIQRRMQTQPNQFSIPAQESQMQPPDFYQTPATNKPSGPDADRSRLYDPTYGGPMINPYAPVGTTRNNNPYPGITVSPTGEVMGAEPVPAVYGGESANSQNPSAGAGPTTSRNAERRDPATGQSKNQKDSGPKGMMNPDNDPRMKQMKGGAFIQGGRDWKGYSDKEKKFLGADATLSEALRQLIASQGDFASQYNTATGNIGDTFRRQINDINRNRGVARSDLENSMASSGLMRSSGYGEELGNLTADFARQAFDARMNKTTGLAEQLAERQNFMRQLEIARTQAREEALRRYATKQFEIGGLIG